MSTLKLYNLLFPCLCSKLSTLPWGGSGGHTFTTQQHHCFRWRKYRMVATRMNMCHGKSDRGAWILPIHTFTAKTHHVTSIEPDYPRFSAYSIFTTTFLNRLQR